jgi:probable HAF family extracellular repeat protein
MTVRFNQQAPGGHAGQNNQVANPPPQNEPERSTTRAEARIRWVHANGSFERLGPGRWQETLPKNKLRFSESAHNEKYIEIRRAPGVVVRLYDDHCQVKFPEDREFKLLYRGTWQAVGAKPNPPAVATGGAAKPRSESAAPPSSAWVHSRGGFRHVEGKRWEETLPGNKLAFVEERRTDEFIEIRRDPGVIVRLYADHCDVKFPEERAFRLLYRGAWKTAPGEPSTKPVETVPAEVLVRDLPALRMDAPRRRQPVAPPQRTSVERTEESQRELARLTVQALMRADSHEIERARDRSLQDDPDVIGNYPGGTLKGKPLARLLDAIHENQHAVPPLLDALNHRLHANVEHVTREEDVRLPVQLLGAVGPAAKDAVPQLIGILKVARLREERRHREPPATIDVELVKRFGLPGLRVNDLHRTHEPLLSSSQPTAEACVACIRALGRIGPAAAAVVPELEAWLAAGWISNEPGEEGRDRLSFSEFTKLETAIALSRIQPKSPAALQAILDRARLWDKLEWSGSLDSNETIVDVIKAMQVAPGDAIKALAKVIEQVPENRLEWLACTIAQWPAEEEQVATVLRGLAASQNDSVRRAAQVGQRELTGRSLLRQLRAAYQRKDAAPLLGQVGSFPEDSLELPQMLAELAAQSSATSDALLTELSHRGSQRRRDAALVLLLMPAPPKNSAPLLLRALADRDWLVQQRAAGALSKLEAAAAYPIAGLRDALADVRGQFAAYVIAQSGPRDAETVRAMKGVGDKFPLLAGCYLSHDKTERETALQLLTASKENPRSSDHTRLANLVIRRLETPEGHAPTKVQRLAEQLLLDEAYEYRVAQLSGEERAERIVHACGDAPTALSVVKLWSSTTSDDDQRGLSERGPAVLVLASLAARDPAVAQTMLREAAAGSGPAAELAKSALRALHPTAAFVPALGDTLKLLADSPELPESGATTEQYRKHSDDVKLAQQLLLWLADLGPDAAGAVPAIEAVIKKHPRLIPQGIHTLGVIGQPATAALVRLLGHTDSYISTSAGQALVAIAPEAAGQRAELEQIASAGLKEPSQWAAGTLANMGEAGRDRLVGLLGESTPARGVWLVEGLASAGRASSTRLARVALDEQQFEEVRLAAATQLAATNASPEPAFDLLVKLLSSKSPELRRAAAAAIATLREPPAAAQTAVQPLVALLVPPNEEQVREVLAQLGRAQGVWNVDGQHWPSDEERAYVRALGSLGPAARPAVAKLLRWLSCAPDKDVELALCEIGPDAAAMPELFALLNYDQRRGSAGRVLAAADDDVLRQSMPLLSQELKSRQPAARAYAAYLAGRLGEPAKGLVPQLIESLRIDDDGVLMATAFALRQIGAPAAPATADLQRLLKSGQSREVEREMRAALNRLVVLGGKGEVAPLGRSVPQLDKTARFRIVALPSPPASSLESDYDPFDLAPTGVRPAVAHAIALAGESVLAHRGNQILIFRDGQWQPLSLQAPDRTQVRGWDCKALNAAGQIGGAVSVQGRAQGFVFRGTGSTVVLLEALFEKPGDRRRDCTVEAISSRGDAVGCSEIEAKDRNSSSTRRACGWQQDKVRDLGLLPGGNNSAALALNEHGLIVGQSEIAGQRNEDGDLPMRACLWKDGRIQDLGVLPGFRDSIAVGVNNSGLIVGRCYTRLNPGSTPADFRAVPCAWKDGKILSLEGFGGADAYACGVNDLGQIVGRSHTATDPLSPTFQAFLWENGKLLDLNELIPAEDKARWILRDARAINGRGQILAVGQLRQELHNVLLEPLSGKP